MSAPSPAPVLRDWVEDEVIGQLGRSSPDVWDSMLEETGVISHCDMPRSPSSSAGDLDRLSNETIIQVLQLLDLQSLCAFMAASFRTKELVQSMFMHRDLLQHASPALIALGKIRLVSYHSVLDLHAVLVSEDCVSCHRFGAFLFLPTCERACLNCLHRNMRFWVKPDREAQRLYGIPQKERHRLPSMMSTPFGKLRKRRRLVSVKLARELSLEVHGSREAMIKRILQSGLLNQDLDRYIYWAEAGEKLLEWNIDQNLPAAPRSPYWGTASIRFPHLRRDRGVDPGYWCEGCRQRRKRLSEYSNYSHGMDYICASPEDEKELEIRHREEIREWTRSGLKDHVITCMGAQELASRQV